MTTIWMIRSGRGSEHVEAFVEHGVAALGWAKLGKLDPLMKKDDLVKLFASKHPEEREGQQQAGASQVFRFLTEVQVGDQVVTYDRDRRTYLIGEITSAYEWKPELIEELPHVRRVMWTHEVSRDVLTTATKNTLGAIQTLIKLTSEAAKDLTTKAMLRGQAAFAPAVAEPEDAPEAEERGAYVEEQIGKADDFIEDAINLLNPEQVPQLMAGILRAMGYRTTVSEPGPDRGVDIFASPDGLGLQEPRIFVEVKHRQAQMGSKEIRAFLGGRKRGDKCLYVSTGGFSKDARYEAERADVPTTLITLSDLRRLLVDYYETIDAETRALVPLKRVYWPSGRK